MRKRIALLLSVVMVASLCMAGCGSKDSKNEEKVYAVEAGLSLIHI